MHAFILFKALMKIQKKKAKNSESTAVSVLQTQGQFNDVGQYW